jgi:hexosaminidase
MKKILKYLIWISSVNAFAIRPTTIPAIREWTDGSGSFTLSPSSRIVVDNAYVNRLASTGSVFADDISKLTGFKLPVVNAPNASAGDIFLSLGSNDSQLGKEGYSLAITNLITIKALSDTGTFYGTRTLLQLFKQTHTIACGTIRDWPDYAERSFMIDNGRKYITVDWLKAYIKEMAYLKLNTFQLHLSDIQGFRLQSTLHPEISSAQCYTRVEMDSIQALAKRYKINIVPEIDMPGHMDAMLIKHPELKSASGNFDLTKSASYDFIKAILNEFIPWFHSPNWHTGADEFKGISDAGMDAYAKAHYGANAVARDVYIGFVNFVDSIVKSKGKTLRAWSDVSAKGVAVNLNKDITMDVWFTYGLTPQQLINDGHLIINSNRLRLYYVIGQKSSNCQNDKTLYEVFKPSMFVAGDIADKDPKNLGTKMHVWCDSPTAETETQLSQNIYHSLRDIAQKSWGSPLLVSTFKDFAPIIGAIGSAPGLSKSFFDVPDTGDIALYKPVTVSSLDPVIPTFKQPSTEIYHAVDGDMITRWKSANSGAQWMIIDLLANYQVNRIKITWENGFGTTYKLDVSTDNVNWTNVYSTTSGNGGIDDNSFNSKLARYVKLYGTPSNGYSLWECEVYAAGTNTSIENITEQDDMVIFPNPASDKFFVNLANIKSSQITMYDMMGRQLVQKNSNKQTEVVEINVAGFVKGLYLLNIHGENGTIVKKIEIK